MNASTATRDKPLTYAELAHEFTWTWSRHRGSITAAATVFECSPRALAKRLQRARRAGFPVTFHLDSP